MGRLTPCPAAAGAAGDEDAITAAVALDVGRNAPVVRPLSDVRAYELAPGLWSLRLPLAYRATASVNCFLLAEGDGSFTLVDCGSHVGHGGGALLAALDLAGVEPAAVTRLLLTHLHTDHASLAPWVLETFDCELIRLRGPDTAWDALRDPVHPLEARRARARAAGVGARDLAVLTELLLVGDSLDGLREPDRWLEPGDEVLGAGARWQVLDGTGHSPNQLLLHDTAGSRMIAADAAYPGIRPYLEWGHSPDPVAEYRATLDRIEAAAPAVLLASHGRPEHDVPARLASARAALGLAEARTLAALGDEPSSPYAVACRLAGVNADPDWRQSTLSVTHCVLEHHRRTGRLREQPAPGGVRRFTPTEGG